MNDTMVYTVAFGLMALSLPLMSYGTTNEVAPLWGIGFAILAVGILIPPVLRYTNNAASSA